MSSPLTDLFNDLSEGLILMAHDGQVRFANRAAREDFGAVEGTAICPAIRETLIRWRGRGYVSIKSTVSLPVSLASRAGERMYVTLYEGLLDGETALLIRSAPDAGRHDEAARLMLQAMSVELRGALRAAADTLSLVERGLRAGTAIGREAMEPLARHCELGATRLELAMVDVACRLQAGREGGSAYPGRAAIHLVLADAVASVRGFYAGRSVELCDEPDREGGVEVLGSGLVLRWAFSALLRAVAQAALPGSKVHCSVRPEVGRVFVRVLSTPPAGATLLGRSVPAEAREIAERLFAETGASVTSVTSARRASSAHLVSLPAPASSVSGYLQALAEADYHASELASLVLRQIAHRASRA